MTDGPAAESAPESRQDAMSPAGDLGPPRAGPDDRDPPWWGARAWLGAAWRRGGSRTRIALVIAGAAAAALLGAFLFGAWHVIVGGFVRGNWSAAAFGFALAGVSGALLWLEAWLAGRLLR